MKDNTGEYELLGYRVKFRPETSESVNPTRIVGLVLDEVAKIKAQAEVHNDEAILLAALKFASDRTLLEEGMKENISQLQSSAADALQLVEKAMPSQA